MKSKLIIYAAIAAFASYADAQTTPRYNWEDDLHHRLLCDFDQSREEVKSYIQRYIPDVTDQQIDAWEQSKALECMTIDGKKLYFCNAGSNLFRIDANCAAIKRKVEGTQLSNHEKEDERNLPKILQAVASRPYNTSRIAEPKRMRVKYTLTVKPDAVPGGEIIRCWLPFPRRDVERQKDVKLLSTNISKYKLSNSSCPHSTVYMEQKAVAGKPTVFEEVFEYTAYGASYDLNAEYIRPYNQKSKFYKLYTSERERHIVFTPRLRKLSDSLTARINSPVEKAKHIFCWIDENFPWASAREYSTIECIPEYVVSNRHGDCGQVSLLFITLCRIAGIPARWQSGFMMHPNGKSLHDWAEVYFEGIGWVPVDQSFGQPSYAKNEAERYFFFGGIDSWRMIVNLDYGRALSPQKKYPRSETVDFQRGEVEWAGGNLYFDRWTYNYTIEYLD